MCPSWHPPTSQYKQGGDNSQPFGPGTETAFPGQPHLRTYCCMHLSKKKNQLWIRNCLAHSPCAASSRFCASHATAVARASRSSSVQRRKPGTFTTCHHREPVSDRGAPMHAACADAWLAVSAVLQRGGSCMRLRKQIRCLESRNVCIVQTRVWGAAGSVVGTWTWSWTRVEVLGGVPVPSCSLRTTERRGLPCPACN